MSLTTTSARYQYSGNGSATVFAFPEQFHAQGDLVVITTTAGVDSTKVIVTDYTVSGVLDPSGGTVVFNTAPASGTTVTIYRSPSATQSVDYVAQDNFPAETHEQALDRLTMLVQLCLLRLNRSLQVPVTAADVAVPDVVTRANKTWVFDSSGNLILSQDAKTSMDAAAASAAAALSYEAGALAAAAAAEDAAAAAATYQAKIEVATIAALKALSVATFSDGDVAVVRGYTAAGDGGGGAWYRDASSVETDNGGTIIAPTTGTGRWKLIHSGSVSCLQFGVIAGNSDNSVAVANAQKLNGMALALAGRAEVVIPPGKTIWVRVSTEGERIQVASGLRLRVDGTIKRVGQLDSANYQMFIGASSAVALRRTVTTLARVSGVVSVTTSSNHGRSVGDVVYLDGVLASSAELVGFHKITATPTTTEFLFDLGGSDIASYAEVSAFMDVPINDVRIYGSGVIDGNAFAQPIEWENPIVKGYGKAEFFRFDCFDGFVLEGVTLRDSPQFLLNISRSRTVRCQGVTGLNSGNNDIADYAGLVNTVSGATFVLTGTPLRAIQVGVSVYVNSGTGAGQYRRVTAYNTGTKQVTVNTAFSPQLDGTSEVWCRLRAGVNTDCFHFYDCSDVVVADCVLQSGDDCVAFTSYSSIGFYSNFTVSNCVLKGAGLIPDHKARGGGLRITTEGTGVPESQYLLRRLTVTGNVFEGTSAIIGSIGATGATNKNIHDVTFTGNLIVDGAFGVVLRRRHKGQPYNRYTPFLTSLVSTAACRYVTFSNNIYRNLSCTALSIRSADTVTVAGDIFHNVSDENYLAAVVVEATNTGGNNRAVVFNNCKFLNCSGGGISTFGGSSVNESVTIEGCLFDAVNSSDTGKYTISLSSTTAVFIRNNTLKACIGGILLNLVNKVFVENNLFDSCILGSGGVSMLRETGASNTGNELALVFGNTFYNTSPASRLDTFRRVALYNNVFDLNTGTSGTLFNINTMGTGSSVWDNELAVANNHINNRGVGIITLLTGSVAGKSASIYTLEIGSNFFSKNSGLMLTALQSVIQYRTPQSNLLGYGYADLSATGDASIIPMSSINGRFIIRRIVLDRASVNISASGLTAELRTAAGGGGSNLIGAVNVSNLTGSSKYQDQALAASVTTDIVSAGFVYFRVTGGTISANIRIAIYGDSLI